MKIEEKGYGKINLTLDVLGKRTDGYHEVEMVMQTIELADIVEVSLQDGISVSSNHKDVPLDETNLVYKVAVALKNFTNCSKGAHIHIEKKIPVAAGLAGGSTNGASALVALNKLWELGLSQEELSRIGANLGSDIPFCLLGGTAIARGRGELLTPIDNIPLLNIVLVKPSFSVSTKEVYGRYNPEKVKNRPQLSEMIKAIKGRDTQLILDSLGNVFESVTFEMHPELASIKQRLLEIGARAALMSGSGPTIFAVAETEEQAHQIAKLMEDSGREIFVTRTHNK